MRTFTFKEFILRLSKLPLVHQPGPPSTTRHTDVLGYLVEVVSGQPFDVYLSKHIFDPLRMIDSGFDVPEESARAWQTV